MDAQLEATYEGPEAVQRLQLSITMTNELFLAQFRQWIVEMRRIASDKPGTGACTLATAMQLWLWTLNHLQTATDADGSRLYHKSRQGVTFPLADALCWLLAARQLILDVMELETKGPSNPALADGLPGLLQFFTDLCHVQARGPPGKRAGFALNWFTATTATPPGTSESCHACYDADELDALEGIIPGIAGSARANFGHQRSRPGASHQSRAVRVFHRLGSLCPPAHETRWLLDRLPAGQRSRGGSADEGDDSRSAGLSGVTPWLIPLQRLPPSSASAWTWTSSASASDLPRPDFLSTLSKAACSRPTARRPSKAPSCPACRRR